MMTRKIQAFDPRTHEIDILRHLMDVHMPLT